MEEQRNRGVQVPGVPAQTLYLNRRTKRALAKAAGLPWGQIAQYNGPVTRQLKQLFYWRGLSRYGEVAHYHIFSHCRRLFNEWAGRGDLKEGRADKPKYGAPPCPECVESYRAGRTF